MQHKQTRELYALKYINKVKCVKMKAVANVIQERRLLEEVCPDTARCMVHRSFILNKVDHAFIVNLRYAFQDDENCFFVLDLMLGGDLRCELVIYFKLSSSSSYIIPEVHLERLGSLPENTVRFYVAEIASALSFLHQSRIMHRSVCNVLVYRY